MASRWYWLVRPTLLRTLLSQLRLGWRLLREPRVPLLTKILPAGAAAYLLLPLDLMPDMLPVLGQLDDVAILLGTVEVFLRLCPPAAVAFHRAELAGRRPFAPMPATEEFIDAEWRREPD